MPPTEHRDARDLVAVGRGRRRGERRARATPSSSQRAELERRRAVPVDEAVAGLGERVAHRERAVAEHDAHALRGGRSGDVVHQPKARVVGVVDVVDREQKAVRRRREAHELGRPRRTDAGGSCHPSRASPCRRARGRSPPDDGRRGRRASVGCRRHTSASASTTGAYGHAPSTGAEVPRPTRKLTSRARSDDRLEQRRLPDTGRRRRRSTCGLVRRRRRAARARRSRSPASRPIRASSLADRDVSLGQQAIPQRDRLASGRHAELTAHRAIHALELAERRVPVAVGRVPAHEREMRDLVARVDLDDGLPPAVELEQVEVAKPQLLATVLRPVFVAVVGEQLAARTASSAVRAATTSSSARARRARSSNSHDVDRGRRSRGRARRCRRGARPRSARRSPGGRSAPPCAAWVPPRRRCRRATSRSSTCSRCRRSAGAEREHLHERGGVTPSPVTVCDGDRVDGHTEVTEHRDVDRRHAIRCKSEPGMDP